MPWTPVQVRSNATASVAVAVCRATASALRRFALCRALDVAWHELMPERTPSYAAPAAASVPKV